MNPNVVTVIFFKKSVDIYISIEKTYIYILFFILLNIFSKVLVLSRVII